MCTAGGPIKAASSHRTPQAKRDEREPRRAYLDHKKDVAFILLLNKNGAWCLPCCRDHAVQLGIDALVYRLAVVGDVEVASGVRCRVFTEHLVSRGCLPQ